MLKAFASYLTDKLYAYCLLDPRKRAIYVYGFQLSLSTMGSMCSIVILALAFRSIYSAFAFLGVFFVLQIFSGGYHAPTYARCFVLTNVVYLAVYGGAQLIWGLHLCGLLPFLTVVSCMIIVLLAPIRNQPMSEAVFKKNQKIARFLAILQGSTLMILYFFSVTRAYLAIPALSLTAVAAMMVLYCYNKGENK